MRYVTITKQKNMRLKNYTDIPSDIIREIIRAVKPNGIGKFDVRVSNKSGTHWAGRAYTRGSAFHDTADPFIVCRIARTDHATRGLSSGENGYLRYAVGSRLEALVAILSHELRHLWQANHTRGKVYGARGRFSERDADAYALGMLRRYRRGEL
jgi:hypothetical protein